ncbi:hypothetical protein FQN49_000240 [Arthroderma sp. PD_2]|nr:hypothetical protein FQN49_000240 [Arthroderma sp. PD_2]
MASNENTPRIELSDSAVTLPSDSENYSATIELSPPSGQATTAPVTLYTPPSYWQIIQGAAINLILPFVNGLMLGFGELFAHEAAFRLGWSNTKSAGANFNIFKDRQNAALSTLHATSDTFGGLASQCSSVPVLGTHVQLRALQFSDQRSPNASSLNSARSTQFRSRLVGQNDTALSALRLSRRSGQLKASSRFASTTATTSASTSAVGSAPGDSASIPGAEDVTSGIDALSSASLTDFDLSRIPKNIGYLKELGLDYGWGPSSVIEFLLENLHITAGLPWWGATVAAAVLIRAVLFKSILSASEVSGKLQTIKPLAAPIRERMLKCARESDNIGALKAKQELAFLNEKHGVKPWKAFVPLIQVPLGFGCFRVLRGMSALPVPGLDSESVLWLHSVTMSDPLFVLPVMTSAMMYMSLKRGGDAGTSNLNNTALGKAMLYGMPGITLATMSFWPGILQLYFLTTGFLSMCQSYLMTSPAFRKFARLGPLPMNTPFSGSSAAQPPPSRIRTISTTATSVPEPESHIQPQKVSIIDQALDGAKSTYRDAVKEAKEKMESMSGEKSDADSTGLKPRLNKSELENAKAYESRRKAEIRAERELKNQQLRAKYLKKSEQKE